MSSNLEELPDWERLLAAERHLQHLVPGTTLVGGTAAALHARHRVSMDGDHVPTDLRERFDDVLRALEAAAGWRTERVRRPVLILSRPAPAVERLGSRRRSRPPLEQAPGAARSGGLMPTSALERSRALWNRDGLNLDSDEVLAQIIDRGELAAWRELYRLARTDAELRRRIKRVVLTTPVSMPRFWLAALAALGEDVDLGARLPDRDDTLV